MRKQQRLVSWLLLPPAIAFEAVALLIQSAVLLVLSGVFSIIYVVFSLVNWRCPYCHHLLPVVGDELKCERCGFYFEAEQSLRAAA